LKLRVAPENETHNVFRYEIDENIPVQSKNTNGEGAEAITSCEDSTEVYCDWIQTLPKLSLSIL
jgi:hypothetical protein